MASGTDHTIEHGDLDSMIAMRSGGDVAERVQGGGESEDAGESVDGDDAGSFASCLVLEVTVVGDED